MWIRGLTVVLALCAVLPEVWWLRQILRRTPDVPFTDEWVWTPVAVAIHHGFIPWALLWAPHNGHRNFVGSLIFVALDAAGGWSVVREDLVGLAVVSAGLVAFAIFARRVFSPIFAAGVVLGAAVVLAGPQPFENFLIGYNIDWQLCTAALLVLAERLTARDRAALPVALGAALVASFSSAQGLLLWGAGFLILLVQRASRMTLAVWTGLAALTFAAYSVGYDASGAPGMHPANLRGALIYATTLVGVPLRDDFSLRGVAVLGVVLSATLIVLAIAAARVAVPRAANGVFAGFAFYGLAAVALTTYARGGLPVVEATSPRYASLTGFILLAAIGFGISIAQKVRPQARIMLTVVGAVATLLLARTVRMEASVVQVYEDRRARELTALRNHDTTVYRDLAYPDPGALEEWLRELAAVNDGPLRTTEPAHASRP